MTDHQDNFRSLLSELENRTTVEQTDLDALLEPGETLQGAIDRLKAQYGEVTQRIKTRDAVTESLARIEEIKRRLWGGQED